ncbi:glutathione S-transferase [Roseateles saccharophilus]|uniref:Glutathione S-transferase n=1 Tax=Roseateles saccharophilus TaxID=304 RepID=A0A4V2VPF8_ROSSA|nr:glutathione S-transferase [Roseateles saccharophilus]MDG0834430.1 glutathione S-transferase [Roseateles saccharophilus]TCU89858.1 glutathione S-transferase [Roseateles saccharophilus]
MKLIGMLDSPYVRRVAITMRLSGLGFEHAAISVFRGFDEFQHINPVVKAPTLVCDDGTVLMDSTLMLEYIEALSGRRFAPCEPALLARELRLTGLALAACEKTAQIVYERGLRPAEKRHEPWIARVSGQLDAAYRALEAELAARPLDGTEAGLGQAGITTAVAWTFTQFVLPEVVPADAFPRLVAHAAACEAQPVFRAIPCDDGVQLQAS